MAIESVRRARIASAEDSARSKQNSASPADAWSMTRSEESAESAGRTSAPSDPRLKSEASSSQRVAAPGARQLRLRRVASIVEYDPENPFDDKQRSSASIDRPSSSTTDAARSRANGAEGQSRAASRQSAGSPSRAEGETNSRSRASRERRHAKEKCSNARAVESQAGRQRIRTRPSALVDESAKDTHRSSQKSAAVEGRQPMRMARLSDSRVPTIGSSASPPDIANDVVSPQGFNQHELSKETADSLSNLEMMLQLARAKSPDTRGSAAARSFAAPSASSARRFDKLSDLRKPARRTLSPSKERARQQFASTCSSPPRRTAEDSTPYTQLRMTAPAQGSFSRRDIPRSANGGPDEKTPHPREEDIVGRQSLRRADEETSVRRSPRLEQRSETSSRRATADAASSADLVSRASRLGISSREVTASAASSPDLIARPSDRKNNKTPEQKATKRRFLRGLTVLVDVRDQDGNDESEPWRQRLREAGANVLDRPPRTPSRGRSPESSHDSEVNYVVCKNSRPSTMQWYRDLIRHGANESPALVSVNWVTASLNEERAADVRDFLVEFGKQPASRSRTSGNTERPFEENNENQPGAGHKESLSVLVARRKSLTSAPSRPSPLARRCWNVDSSTSSIATLSTTASANVEP